MGDCIFLAENKQAITNAYTEEQISGHPILDKGELFSAPPQQAHYVFSTWGMPVLTEDEIKTHLPELKAVFYAAGTVQSFARPFIRLGMRVFSAWAANAVPVAEFAAAQIVLANKGYFQLHKRYLHYGHAEAAAYANSFFGNYGVSVGILGAGAIGEMVIKLLKPYDIRIKVFDPFLSDLKAAELRVVTTDLNDIFTSCQTISNHLANNDKTKNILSKSHFDLMKDNATFINTGRGAQVVTADLIDALRNKPDRTALLDVTDPDEPLPPDHPLWSLSNVFITPHRAGSAAGEIRRMGQYMFDEYENVLKNEKALYEVTMEMLETMA